jgi:protein ImuB
MYTPSRGKLWVTACSRSAGAHGVVPGMPLAEARALCAGIPASFEPHDPQADREALRRLAEWCQRFSPLVAMEETAAPDSLLLNITGCAHLFGGEEALAAQVVAELSGLGYWATAACADTIGAAWAVAHYGCRRSLIVSPSGHVEALRPLPVAALRLPAHVVELLLQFDIRRIGALLELPRDDLPARFGALLNQRLDQALGNISELLTYEPWEEPVETSWSFEPATADRRALETVLGHLLEQVLERLRPRQLGVQRLTCSFALAAREALPLPVSLLRPSASSGYLMELVRLHLERLRVPAEVSAVTIRATAVPLEIQQGRIFESDDRDDRRQELPALIERLSSRLGEKSVLRPYPRADAQPEFAWRYEAWLGTSSVERDARSAKRRARRKTLPSSTLNAPTLHSPTLPATYASRPPYLKVRPIAVAVVSIVPGGPPLRFEWQGHSHVVARYWGPERIETGWWRGPDVRRDYYLVETSTGERFWLFRTIVEEKWFLHGAFV